jgi:hypothetical protein
MKISQHFVHREGVYCFIGPESYEVNETVLQCARQMNGVYCTSNMEKSAYLSMASSCAVFGQASDMKIRGQLIRQAMEFGYPTIAVYIDPREDMTFPAGVDEAKVLDSAKKIAKPTPTEGWTQIYRYTPDTGMVLVWDALTGKKSDKLSW